MRKEKLGHSRWPSPFNLYLSFCETEGHEKQTWIRHDSPQMRRVRYSLLSSTNFAICSTSVRLGSSCRIELRPRELRCQGGKLTKAFSGLKTHRKFVGAVGWSARFCVGLHLVSSVACTYLTEVANGIL